MTKYVVFGSTHLLPSRAAYVSSNNVVVINTFYGLRVAYWYTLY